MSVLDACEADIEATERAITALDDGSYGVCARCGDVMPDDDLADVPLRVICAAHGLFAV